MTSVDDLGATLAQHPLFGQAWAEKLCYYANSSACEPSDPEFKRVVGVFTSSGYSWSALVAELLASPLTTNAAPTATRTQTDPGEGSSSPCLAATTCAPRSTPARLRRLCGLDAIDATPQTHDAGDRRRPPVRRLRPRSAGARPAQPARRSSTGPGRRTSARPRRRWSSTCRPRSRRRTSSSGRARSRTAAIADFVQIVMGLPPSDPRAAPAPGAPAGALHRRHAGRSHGDGGAPVDLRRRRASRPPRSRSGCERSDPHDPPPRRPSLHALRRRLRGPARAGHRACRRRSCSIRARRSPPSRRPPARRARARRRSSSSSAPRATATRSTRACRAPTTTRRSCTAWTRSMAPTTLTLAGQSYQGGGAVGDAPAERPRPHDVLAHHDQHAGAPQGAGRPQAPGLDPRRRDAPVDPGGAARALPGDDPDAADHASGRRPPRRRSRSEDRRSPSSPRWR